MLHRTTILGAILLNITFICLGIWISPYFFFLVGVNIVILIIQFIIWAAQENSYSSSYNRRKARAEEIIDKSKRYCNDREFLLSAMNKIIELKTIYEANAIMENASRELKNDKDFILQAIKFKSITLAHIGSQLRKDADFMNTVKEVRISNRKSNIQKFKVQGGMNEQN